MPAATSSESRRNLCRKQSIEDVHSELLMRPLAMVQDSPLMSYTDNKNSQNLNPATKASLRDTNLSLQLHVQGKVEV